MTTTIYRSTDGSAPVLTGQVGALVALLDACLVNGYGAKAAAGWTKPYTNTNGGAYRQGGSGFYWQVDDNAPGAALAKEARMRGFETMSAWNTGTGLFPTVAQLAAGAIARKSATADATARVWTLAADDRTCHVFVFTGDNANVCLLFSFGDFYSVKASDAYKCAIIGRAVENPATATAVLTGESTGDTTNPGTGQAGHYFARNYIGISAAAVQFGKHMDRAKSVRPTDSVSTWSGALPFPNPADGGLYLSPVFLHESTTIRGRLRGLWQVCHVQSSFANGDTFDGAGEYAGRSFQIIRNGCGAGAVGGHTDPTYGLETTAWDTSI